MIPRRDDGDAEGHPSEVDQGRFADRIHVEPDIEAAAMVKDVSAVKDEGGLHHGIENPPEVEMPVGIPLGEKGDGVAPLCGKRGIFDVTDFSLDPGKIGAGILQGLRIGDDELGPFLEKSPGDEDGRALTRVPRVRLEGETPQADPSSRPVC